MINSGRAFIMLIPTSVEEWVETWLGIFFKNQPKNYVIEIAWKCCNRYDDEDFQCLNEKWQNQSLKFRLETLAF